MDEGFGGLGGLSDDESMRARDAANMSNQDMEMGMSFGNEPQSLSDVDTYGMGEGLSAARDMSGLGEGISFSAGLPDEEEEEEIHAALQDEEEESPIMAGRADPSPINAGYGKVAEPSDSESMTKQPEEKTFVQEKKESMYDEYGNLISGDSNTGGSHMDHMADQSIDSIFIANSFGGGTRRMEESGPTEHHGTMYSGDKKGTNVHVSFGMPKFLKRIIILLVFLCALYCVLEYACGVKLERFVKPVDVQQYSEIPTDQTASTLDVEFEKTDLHYSNSVYDITYNVEDSHGLKYYNMDGKRLFIMVTDFCMQYSIYGMRPYLTTMADAEKKLPELGYECQGNYVDSDDYSTGGQEYAYYNKSTGEGVFLGKKESSDRIRGIKYVKDYKKYVKIINKAKNVQ